MRERREKKKFISNNSPIHHIFFNRNGQSRFTLTSTARAEHLGFTNSPASNTLGFQIPKEEVVDSSATGNGHAFLNELVGEVASILLDLNDVSLELGSHGLLQLSGNTSNLRAKMCDASRLLGKSAEQTHKHGDDKKILTWCKLKKFNSYCRGLKKSNYFFNIGKTNYCYEN